MHAHHYSSLLCSSHTFASTSASAQVDILQEKYGVQFNTVSFSGGGGSYSYRFKTMSTVSTKIQFQISFKDM